MLEQLWNGQIAPYKTCGNSDPEVQELAELLERNKIKLEQTLSEEQMELLKKYFSCFDEYNYLIMVHAFRKGFCLAAKLLAEVFAEETI